MTFLASPRRSALPALLAVAALALGGCQMRVGANVASEGNLRIGVAIVDDDGLFDVFGISCADLDDQADLGEELGGFAETEIDGHRACVAESAPVAPDGNMFRDNGDTYSVVLDNVQGLSGELEEEIPAGTIDLRLSVTMPGSITEYTEGGVLDGTTVAYGLGSVPDTVVVTGLKSGESGQDPVVLADGEQPGGAAAEGTPGAEPSAKATTETATEATTPSLSSPADGDAGSGSMGDDGDSASAGLGSFGAVGVGVVLAAVGGGWLAVRSRRKVGEAAEARAQSGAPGWP